MDVTHTILTTCLNDEISTVCAWDAYNGTILSRYRGGGNCAPHGLDSSGGYILTCEKSKPMLHIWAFNKQHCENKRLIAPGRVNTIAFSKDSTHIALGISEKLYLYQTSSGRMMGIGSRHFQSITVIKFSNNGTLISCGGEDGLVTVWNINMLCQKEKNPEPLHTFTQHTLPVTDLIFTSGNTLSRVISVSMDRTCKVYDLASGQVLLSLVFEVRLTTVALTSIEMDLYIGDAEGKIHEFSLRSPPRTLDYHIQNSTQKSMFIGHEKAVTCVTCVVDCCHIVSGSQDETIKIWHISSRQCLRTILQKGPVTNIICLTIPKSYFGHEFKAKAIMHDFINPANVDEDEELSFDIMVSEDLMPSVVNLSENCMSLISNEEPNEEIDRLKSINNAMFKFSVNKILQKKPTSSKVNTNGTTSVLEGKINNSRINDII